MTKKKPEGRESAPGKEDEEEEDEEEEDEGACTARKAGDVDATPAAAAAEDEEEEAPRRERLADPEAPLVYPANCAAIVWAEGGLPCADGKG